MKTISLTPGLLISSPTLASAIRAFSLGIVNVVGVLLLAGWFCLELVRTVWNTWVLGKSVQEQIGEQQED